MNLGEGGTCRNVEPPLMMGEQRCKCRFIVVNRRVLNRMHNFQAAEKAWLLILGVHLLPMHPPAYATEKISLLCSASLSTSF